MMDSTHLRHAASSRCDAFLPCAEARTTNVIEDVLNGDAEIGGVKRRTYCGD